jgi:anti-sigma-K factor RskA
MPDDVRELLGAYALDALDPDEREQVDELLLTDASARAELHELQQGAAWLGHASLRPPARAWDAIAGEIDRDLSTQGQMPAATRRTPRWLVAAAMVLVLAIGAAGVFSIANRSSSSESVTDEYEAALNNPSARTVTLQSSDGEYAARAVVLRDRSGYLAAESLPVPGSDRDLQLWSLTPDGPVSVGLLSGDEDIHRFRVAPGATALAVTDEPRGGSEAPTGTPIVSGDLERV